MVQIDVEPNPNINEYAQFVFNEIDTWHGLSGIKALDRNGCEYILDVCAVQEGGVFSAAQYIKINDSAEGIAFLIKGGSWGIRLRPRTNAHEPWSLENKNQWGETHKVYGDRKDILDA